MTLDQMRKAVFAQKPVFKAILGRYGDWSLTDYYDQLGANYKPSATPKARRKELENALIRKTKKLLGKRVADELKKYLAKRYVVSTAGHHDFATHPFFANYLIAAGYSNTDAGLPVVPVLTCSGISLNNSSFPRGLLFHDDQEMERRIKLVSLKNHHHPVYGYPSYHAATLAEAILSVDKGLTDILKKTLGGKALKKKLLSDQIGLAVQALYKNLSGLSRTEVVYLPQEEIVVDLFIKHHLKQKTIINRVVFDKTIRESFINLFEGIIGARDTRKGTGTHLFWGIGKTGRVAMHLQDSQLASEDGAIVVALTPAAIKKALEKKQLMPAMSFTFTLLSFYYGLACAGGFSQVNYLTEMKKAYLKLLKTIPGSDTEVSLAEGVPTDLFAGEFVLATLDTKSTAATALDIMLRHGIFTEARLRKLLKATSLNEGVNRMIPELYRIVTQ